MDLIPPLPPCMHSDTDNSDDGSILDNADSIHSSLAVTASSISSNFEDPDVLRQRLVAVEALRRFYKSQFKELKHQLRLRSTHYNQIRANHRLIMRKKRHDLAPYDPIDPPPSRPGQKNAPKKDKHPYTPTAKGEPTLNKAPPLVDAPEPSRVPCGYPQEPTEGVDRCTNMSMAFSSYCFHHILHDPQQKLYDHCSAEGCTAPILVGQSPPLCAVHYVAAAGKNAAVASDPAIQSAVEAHKQKDSNRQLTAEEKTQLPLGDAKTYKLKVNFIKETISDVLIKRQKHRRTAASRSMKRKNT
ncbi:hypothetical protein RCL1_001007 [Eukaryota sp. TZLM3-RCL]